MFGKLKIITKFTQKNEGCGGGAGSSWSAPISEISGAELVSWWNLWLAYLLKMFWIPRASFQAAQQVVVYIQTKYKQDQKAGVDS